MVQRYENSGVFRFGGAFCLLFSVCFSVKAKGGSDSFFQLQTRKNSLWASDSSVCSPCTSISCLKFQEMGNKSSLLLRDEEIAQIQEETGFTPNQIERLYSRFTSLDRGDCGTLSREDFLRIPELAINPLGDRIVHAFFEGGADRVNFRQFMKVLARFRPIKKTKDNKFNSREQKLQFAFKMYDLDNDDKVSRDELLAILHMMVGANISEEQLTSIAERTIMEADQNGDQMISFEEFCKALERTDVEQKMSIRFLN